MEKIGQMNQNFLSFKVHVQFAICWYFCHCVEKCIFQFLLYGRDNWITAKIGNCITFSAKKIANMTLFSIEPVPADIQQEASQI